MDSNAIVYTVYVTALLAICFVAGGAWRRLIALEPLERTATVMAGNWAVNTFYVLATQIYAPWWWFLAVDAVSARAVLHQPAGKAQSAIGFVYMAQIITHAVYFASDRAIAEPRYWQVLIALAFLQLLIMGGWTLGGLVRRVRLRRGARVSVPVRKKGVAK